MRACAFDMGDPELQHKSASVAFFFALPSPSRSYSIRSTHNKQLNTIARSTAALAGHSCWQTRRSLSFCRDEKSSLSAATMRAGEAASPFHGLPSSFASHTRILPALAGLKTR